MLASPYDLRDNPKMAADPFSDILKLVNAETVVSGGFTAGGSWAIRFPSPDKLKFFALIKGHCWLRIEGQEASVRVEAGDVFLLSAQRSFLLAGDLSAAVADATVLFAGHVGKTVKLGEGEDCIQIGGHVRLDPVSGGLLADVLPPLIHVRAGSFQAPVLQWLLDQMVRERAADLPGAGVVSAHLAQLMFVQVLRCHLAESDSFPPGWLRALSDPRIAETLGRMHSDPGRQWQLEELAQSAAMSRTTFASRFKTLTGVPPLTYLLNWRMRLAEHALREENTPISSLAPSLGYTSESAFSNAFKRTVGMAPRHYRESIRAAGATAKHSPPDSRGLPGVL
jgi:AraC-like DNA-binding protein